MDTRNSYCVVVFEGDGSGMEVAYEAPCLDAAVAFVEQWAADGHALGVGIIPSDNALTTTA